MDNNKLSTDQLELYNRVDTPQIVDRYLAEEAEAPALPKTETILFSPGLTFEQLSSEEQQALTSVANEDSIPVDEILNIVNIGAQTTVS